MLNKLSDKKDINSAKINLYYHVRDLMATIPEVKHWEAWNNQLTDYDQHDYQTPAVFFEFVDFENLRTELKTQSNLSSQIDQVDFVVHVVYESYKRSEETFINHLELVDKVYRKIHDSSGSFFSNIIRVRELQDVNHIQVADWQIVFTCQLTECGEDLINGENIRDGEELEEVDRDICISFKHE